MPDIKLIEVKQKTVKVEKLSTAGKAPAEPKQYEAEKKDLSQGIKAFDEKVEGLKKVQASPYDYNVVSLNKKVDYTPTAEQMIMDPVYNNVGKFLGVDTRSEWSQQYDKVRTLVDWAKAKTGSEELKSIMDFLNGALNAAPSFGMNHKRIDQLYLYAKLNMT